MGREAGRGPGVGVTPIRSGELLFAEDPAKKAVIAEPSTDSIDWDRTRANLAGSGGYHCE